MRIKPEIRNPKLESDSNSHIRISNFEFVSSFLTSVVLLTKEVEFRPSTFLFQVADPKFDREKTRKFVNSLKPFMTAGGGR